MDSRDVKFNKRLFGDTKPDSTLITSDNFEVFFFKFNSNYFSCL